VQEATTTTGTPDTAPELKHGALGFTSSLLLGVSSVAPAYSFAAILGLLVAEAGVQAPAVVLISFVPMLFVATAYYWMNRADPDCGTTFAWATKALGPTTGWLAGWSILTAGVIVIGLLANTAASYTYTLVGWDAAADSKWAVIALATAMTIGATYITVRGIEISARTTYVLMALQIGGLLLFAFVALGRVLVGDGGPTSIDPSVSWFSPFAIDGSSALIAGVLLGVFAYWGWDSAVAVNEETKDASHAPGKAAVASTVLLLALYLLITVGALAWLGTEELAAFEDESAASEIASQILASPLDKLVVLAVLTSALASTQTTVLPSSRTLLSMGRKGAMPGPLAQVSPRFQTPTVATWLVGGLAVAFYVVFAGFSESFYENSLLVLGLLICVNYGINALACVVYYRRQMFRSLKTFLTMGLLPVVGFGLFVAIFVKSIRDFALGGVEDTTYWFGVQAPLVIFAGLLLLGLVIIVAVRATGDEGFFARRLETADSLEGAAAVDAAPARA
jgi:amino acid transporter